MEKKNFVYFYGGAIGGFLLAIFLLENIKENFKNKNNKYIVVVPSNKKLYQELLIEYPYIEIVEFGKSNFFNPIWTFMKILFQENYIISAPAFSSESLYKKITAFLLKLFNKNSVYIGFDNNSFLDRILYNKLFVRNNVEKNVFNLMKDIIYFLNLMVIRNIPRFHFKINENILSRNDLIKDEYIVIHPFASNKIRSFPDNRWVEIISNIAKKNPNKKIVITGSKVDKIKAEKIIKNIKEKNVLNYSGKFSLQELMNILNGCWFFVGVDTGVTHMAGMIQKHSLIFGSYSNPCWLPCYNKNAKILMNRENCKCKGNKQGECFLLCKEEKYYRCLFDITDKQIKEGLDFFYRQ